METKTYRVNVDIWLGREHIEKEFETGDKEEFKELLEKIKKFLTSVKEGKLVIFSAKGKELKKDNLYIEIRLSDDFANRYFSIEYEGQIWKQFLLTIDEGISLIDEFLSKL